MTFSAEWNDQYKAGRHLSVWPWSDMVSLCRRFGSPLKGKHVLELGCGMGANIPFFLSEQCGYCATEGSKEACEFVQATLGAPVYNNDFCTTLPEGELDIIADRSSVTHNDSESIMRCLKLVRQALKPGGLFIGVDWFSAKHGERVLGKKVDMFTRNGFTAGQFANVGNVHFSTKRHLLELFADFEILWLEEKVTYRLQPEYPMFGAFNIVARRPA